MKIQLPASEFVHLDNISTYNHNYFSSKNGNMGITLLEICHEDYDFFEYSLVDREKVIFLGCSDKSISDSDILEIDFLYYYT